MKQPRPTEPAPGEIQALDLTHRPTAEILGNVECAMRPWSSHPAEVTLIASGEIALISPGETGAE